MKFPNTIYILTHIYHIIMLIVCCKCDINKMRSIFNVCTYYFLNIFAEIHFFDPIAIR